MYLTQILLLVLQLLHFSAAKKLRTKYGYYHDNPHVSSSSSECYSTHTATPSKSTFTPSSLITSIISTVSSPTLIPPTTTRTFTTSATESEITTSATESEIATSSTALTTPTSTFTSPSTALTTFITTSTTPSAASSTTTSTTSSAPTSTITPTGPSTTSSTTASITSSAAPSTTSSTTTPTTSSATTSTTSPTTTTTTSSATTSTTTPATSSSTTSTTPPATTSATSPTTTTTTTTTTTSTVSSTSSSASPTCTDISGDFINGVLSPWYISDQVTANSHVVSEGVGDTPYSFALIPSQTSVAQVYLNQLLPSCGNPPPLVTLTVRFQYQFTGESELCAIRAVVNRNPSTELLEIVDLGAFPGVWQSFVGEPIEVQLTYDPLFTIQLSCLENNPGIPAILITGISVY